MSVRKAYNTWSATYDSDENLTRDLDQVVTQQTLGNVRCKSILEIGCGTGKNTVLLSQIGERVHAVDFSESMIEVARENVKSSNVTFTIADITKPWPCEDHSSDLIVCNLVLEHIKDLAFVFSEASRSLVERGRFFISELHPSRQDEGAKASFGEDQRKIEIQSFVHYISDVLEAAKKNGFTLKGLKEWRHEADRDKPPRLISFMFEK